MSARLAPKDPCLRDAEPFRLLQQVQASRDPALACERMPVEVSASCTRHLLAALGLETGRGLLEVGELAAREALPTKGGGVETDDGGSHGCPQRTRSRPPWQI